MRYHLATSAASLLPLFQAVSSQSYFNAGRCPQPPTDNNDKNCRCIDVDDYDDLKGAIERMDSNECKCLRPFSVTKSPEESPIEINDVRGATIQCQTLGGCEINGPGTHIFISGEDTEATISGFHFRDATESAIVIADGTGSGRRGDAGDTRDQTICDSSFTNNKNYWHNGGAVKAGAATSTYIAKSTFVSNKAARMGGAVSGESSKLTVLESVFSSNSAALGGAVSSNQPDSTLILLDNAFDDTNVAGLGPAYGPAVAANGLVRDLGGNVANPKDFMCLGCTLRTGHEIQKYNPSLGHYDGDNGQNERNRYGSNNKMGRNPGTVVDELNENGGNPEFLAYELYDEDDEWGPFHLKLFFGDGYQWQGLTKDLNVCLEYKYSSKNVEGKGDPMILNGCNEDKDEQKFIARGDKTIRLAEDDDLCITYVGARGLEIHECNGSIFQQWDRVQKSGQFKISPVVDHNRCMTNHHHPREKERVYLDWCHLAEDGDTAYWTLRWNESD